MIKKSMKVLLLVCALSLELMGCGGNGRQEETEDLAVQEETEDPVAQEEAEDLAVQEETAIKEQEPVDGSVDGTIQRRAKKKLETMSLEEKVAQLFFLTPESLTGYGKVTQAGDATKKALEKYPVGGLILMGGNLVSEEQVTAMLKKQQEYARERIGVPLFLGIDEEGGAITRIASSGNFDVPVFPDLPEIGATKDADRAYEAGNAIGQYLHRMGFNVDFAPVADVLTNPDNTVVRNRSFGSDPALVSHMVLAQLKGLEENGIYGCLKHYPGHGATAGDTHQGYAYTNKTWEELEEFELVPFIDGIKEGATFIMVGHISLPSVTGTDEPASCSRELIQERLRDELGYQGIVLTDALQMKAITDVYSSAQIAVRVLLAGADMLLEPENFQQAYQGILDAVARGELTEERIDESVLRILCAKYEMYLSI